MSILYAFKEGVAGFRRAKLAAIGSSITITISLLLVGLFYVVSTNTSRFVESVRQKVELEAFLQEPATHQRINEIQQRIEAIDGVDRAQFVSKDDAARIFKEEFGEDVNSVLDFNPLPPSFKIFLKEGFRSPDKAEKIHRAVMEIQGVENIAYRKELLEFLEDRITMMYSIGLGLGILFGISAIFLVSNTIRLTIFARQKSVQTMKLVGASRWFIRAPFLIEGLVQGLIGGVIAAIIIYYLLTFFAEIISIELAQFLHADMWIYGAIILGGMGLGFFGSAISVRKYISESIG
jgi:cell division transport system permease protein